MLQFGYAPTSHGQVHFARTGGGDPLILLPGSSRSYRQFLPMFDLLSPHFDVIAIDTLGYGASAAFPADGSIETLAESVVGTLDALQIPAAHVFGMHTGHKVAAALAAGWAGRVRRVVLAGKTHSIIPDQSRRNQAIRERVAPRAIHRQPGNAGFGLPEWTRAFRNVSSLWWNEAVLASATGKTSQEPSLDGVRHKVIDELVSMHQTAAVYEANYRFDFAAAVSRMKCPALVLEVTHESEDRAFGRQGDRLAALMPDARAVDLPSVDEIGTGCNAEPGLMCRHVIEFLTEARQNG
jgi:pimeloyl-ACP methyl ester carboxylesterase